MKISRCIVAALMGTTMLAGTVSAQQASIVRASPAVR